MKAGLDRALRASLTVLLAAWCASATAAAKDGTPCSYIDSERERLACFDRLFPRPSPAAAQPKPPVAVAAEPAVREVPKASAPERVAQPTAAEVREREEAEFGGEQLAATKQARREKEKEEEKEPGPVNEIESRIARVDSTPNREMVFYLDNDQVWVQTRSRILPIREGQTATIKRGRFGGYTLSNGRGASTKVKRAR